MKNRIEIDMLQQILQIVYNEKIREDEGGTYAVTVISNVSNYPEGQTQLQIVFDTQLEKADYLNEIIHAEFRNIAKAGPRQEDFIKAKEIMLRNYQEQERENSFWLNTIIDFYRFNYDGYTNCQKTVNEVTPADIQKKVQFILDSNNKIEVVMRGVK
jgi:zinc protease